MHTYNNKRAGFSITELLVVMAIIAIVASIVVVNLSSSRGVARDTERVTDVKQLQIAVEEYFDLTAGYPNRLRALVNEDLIQKVPEDPLDSQSYKYNKDKACDGSGEANYSIHFQAENPDTFQDSTDVRSAGGGWFCVEG